MARRKLAGAARALASADAAVAKAVAVRGKQPVLERIGHLGDQPPLRALSIGALALGLVAARRTSWGPRLARAGARMLIAHELATFAKDRVKRQIDRPRPRSLASAGKSAVPRPGDSHGKELTSFPSGHSAGSAAVALAFGREFPEHRAKAIGVAAGLALIQLPRGAHYPGDILAGLAIGAAAEAALGALWPASPLPVSMEPLPCVTC